MSSLKRRFKKNNKKTKCFFVNFLVSELSLGLRRFWGGGVGVGVFGKVLKENTAAWTARGTLTAEEEATAGGAAPGFSFFLGGGDFFVVKQS